jgi:hypothetical protein
MRCDFGEVLKIAGKRIGANAPLRHRNLPFSFTEAPNFKSALREIMGHFARGEDAAARTYLTAMLNDERWLLLVSVCNVSGRV